jgi:hypothetical protein
MWYTISRRVPWLTLVHSYEKPWVDDKRMQRTKIGNWIVMGFIMIGLLASGYIMFTGAQAAKIPAVRHPLLIRQQHI